MRRRYYYFCTVKLSQICTTTNLGVDIWRKFNVETRVRTASNFHAERKYVLPFTSDSLSVIVIAFLLNVGSTRGGVIQPAEGLIVKLLTHLRLRNVHSWREPGNVNKIHVMKNILNKKINRFLEMNTYLKISFTFISSQYLLKGTWYVKFALEKYLLSVETQSWYPLEKINTTIIHLFSFHINVHIIKSHDVNYVDILF